MYHIYGCIIHFNALYETLFIAFYLNDNWQQLMSTIQSVSLFAKKKLRKFLSGHFLVSILIKTKWISQQQSECNDNKKMPQEFFSIIFRFAHSCECTCAISIGKRAKSNKNCHQSCKLAAQNVPQTFMPFFSHFIRISRCSCCCCRRDFFTMCSLSFARSLNCSVCFIQTFHFEHLFARKSDFEINMF